MTNSLAEKRAGGWRNGLKAGIYLLSNVLPVPALAAGAVASVTLQWNPSTDPYVAGYKIYFGTNSHVYNNVVVAGNVSSQITLGIQPGISNYFAATAFDIFGTESDFSNETSILVPIAATLTAAIRSANTFSFSVLGMAGTQYVVQASTNLANWVSVQTNLAPFTFSETNASPAAHKFFRAMAGL